MAGATLRQPTESAGASGASSAAIGPRLVILGAVQSALRAGAAESPGRVVSALVLMARAGLLAPDLQAAMAQATAADALPTEAEILAWWDRLGGGHETVVHRPGIGRVGAAGATENQERDYPSRQA